MWNAQLNRTHVRWSDEEEFNILRWIFDYRCSMLTIHFCLEPTGSTSAPYPFIKKAWSANATKAITREQI